jgi:hypothetical protein
MVLLMVVSLEVVALLWVVTLPSLMVLFLWVVALEVVAS